MACWSQFNLEVNRRTTLALLLALSAATAAPLPFPKEVRNPALKRLQGSWVVTDAVVGGVSDDAMLVVKGALLVAEVRRGQLTLLRGDVPVVSWAVRVSAGEPEGTIDLIRQGRTGGRGDAHISLTDRFLLIAIDGCRGGCRVDGDRLILVFNGEGVRDLLLVLRRKAPWPPVAWGHGLPGEWAERLLSGHRPGRS